MNKTLKMEAVASDAETLKNSNLTQKERMYRIMEQYHSGNDDLKAQAIENALKESEGLIGFIIGKYFSMYKAGYYDDLYNEGVCAIIENLGRYNPEEGAFSTFITYPLIHVMSAFVNSISNKSTPYYSSIMNKVRNAIKHFEAEQFTPSVSDIALYTGLSVKKVEEGLRRIEATKEESFSSDYELDQMMTEFEITPEEELIQKEEHEALIEALKTLTKKDCELLLLKYGILDGTPEKSNNTLAKLTGISVSRVAQSISRSLRILSDNEKLNRLHGKTVKRMKEDDISGLQITLSPSESFLDMYEELEDFTLEEDALIAHTHQEEDEIIVINF